MVGLMIPQGQNRTNKAALLILSVYIYLEMHYLALKMHSMNTL